MSAYHPSVRSSQGPIGRPIKASTLELSGSESSTPPMMPGTLKTGPSALANR